jgi:hypothetical protein
MAERQSFAFEPARVSQSQPSASGQSRGVQMLGGETSIAGGVAAASQFSQVQGDSAQIGGFLTNLLQPAIERKKQQQYVAGMVDQMSAVAGQEIRVNDKNPLNKIFGPSSYEEGAIFYAVQKSTSDWVSNTMADKDNLKKLPPEELTKVVAASFDKMKTGDAFTDTAVQASLIEKSAPVIGAIAKERYAWQQETALNAWSDSADAAGTAFQSTLTSLVQTGDQSDAGNLSANAAHNNFRSLLQKPTGMDDETYRTGLKSFYKKAAQAGNGYAVTAMKTAGVLDLLSDEDVTKLEDAELKYGNRALGKAAMNHADELNILNGNIINGRISPTEGMAQAAALNEKIKGETGFDLDLFDYKEVVGVGKSIWTGLKAAQDRAQDRQWQVQDAAQRHQWELDAAKKKADDEVAQVQMAWGTGQVKTAMAAGIGSTGNFDILATADYAAGNWSNMIRAYDKDQWTSGLVASKVQAQLTSSVGQEYNKDFEGGYQKFSKLNALKPAAAQAYYGDMYAPMLNYQRLVTSGVKPAMAFARAMANPEQYSPKPTLTKTAETALDSWIKGNRSGTWGGTLGFGRDNLNASGVLALKNVAARQLGVLMNNSDTAPEALIPGVYQQAITSGAFEDYGKLGWSNKPGTQNLGKMLGLQQDEADEVVQRVVDKRLKANGWKDGINGDNISVSRIRDSKGNLVVAVQPYDNDTGAGPLTLVPFAMFKDDANATRAAKVARVTPRPNFQIEGGSGGPSGRRIPGETGYQRLKRLNEEARANFHK